VTFSSRHFTFGVLSSALAATAVVAGAAAGAAAAGAVADAGVGAAGVATAALASTGGSAANTGRVINPLAMIAIDFENF
jgi:hypothetical protein